MVYLVLSIVCVPGAILTGLAVVLTVIEIAEFSRIPNPYDLLDLGLSALTAFLAYSFVSSAREANRRLKQLAGDPASNVRPMPVSFLESIFGLK